MGKRWSPGLFCFALLIAFDSAFAAQTEAITEKDKSRIRKSSASRPARAYPWKTNIITTVFWIGEQPVEINSSRIAQVHGTNNGQKATAVSMIRTRPSP